MAPLIVKAHSGQLTFADLYAQQEEARYFLPKLIFILSAAGGHWDVRDHDAHFGNCELADRGRRFLLLYGVRPQARRHRNLLLADGALPFFSGAVRALDFCLGIPLFSSRAFSGGGFGGDSRPAFPLFGSL